KQNYLRNSMFYRESLLNVDRSMRPWVCFDEIHKYPKWKDILKSFYDADGEKTGFLVTGSARLDMFRKSGDSLAGRYFLFRLYPLVLNEISKINNPSMDNFESGVNFIEKRLASTKYEQESMERLLKFSGFPDPFISGKDVFHKKWKNGYMDKLINEDLLTLAHIKEVENVARLLSLLPHKVGSPLSVNSLREDMLVSYNAIKNYLSLIEMAYVTFMITPYSTGISRSIKKEKKLYYYDWTHIPNEGARFENYIALELKAMLEIWNDLGNEFDLNYVRTKDGKESDFLITKDRTPWLIIEAKSKSRKIENHHYRTAAKLGNIQVIQVVKQNNIAEKYSNGYQISASRLFA
ncbi:MAG: ATP-binding protein, partial [Candidatus Anammoxibacter sp.]